jgi:hypothetical protein
MGNTQDARDIHKMGDDMTKRVRLAVIFVAVMMVMSIADRAQAQAAWGGGCDPATSGNRACIGLIWPTLYGDFYLDDWNGVDPDGWADVFFCFPGQTGCYIKYTTYTNYLGHYPVAQMDVPFSSGNGYTVVHFYDAEGNFISYLVSPLQYWAS